jgi:steroid delta-isomerase-like uncharacterized protein
MEQKNNFANAPAALNVVAAYIVAMSQGDSSAMNTLRATDFVLDWTHGDAFDDGPLSADDTNSFWPVWFAGFSEMDYEVTRTIAAESVVVVQWIFTGTHDNPIKPPIFDPPTVPNGRTIRIRGVSVYDVADNLIQRETTYLDLATLIVELGVEL